MASLKNDPEVQAFARAAAEKAVQAERKAMVKTIKRMAAESAATLKAESNKAGSLAVKEFGASLVEAFATAVDA